MAFLFVLERELTFKTRPPRWESHWLYDNKKEAEEALAFREALLQKNITFPETVGNGTITSWRIVRVTT